MNRPYLQVGRIIKPHGVHGEVGVKSLTERPDLRFRPGEELLLGPDESNLEPVTLRSVRSYKEGYLVFFESITDRNAAERMRGWQLFISSDQVPEPGEGRYYHHQLIGLAVQDESGSILGRVSRVLEHPGQDLLEVTLSKGKRVLMPMVQEIVLEVNLDQETLTVSPPEGLLDL